MPADELWSRRSFAVGETFEEFGDVAEGRAFLFGHRESISLLDHRTMLVHSPELSCPCRLTREPVAISFAIFKVELWIAVIGNPDHACWNSCSTAQGDEQAGHFLAVSCAVAKGDRGILQWSFDILHLLANKIVDLFNSIPIILVLARGELFRGCLDAGI